MLGFGPPVDRQGRREWWRRQVQRQEQSHVSVAEFCRRLGVSAVTFYSWKRRFRLEAAGGAASGPELGAIRKPTLDPAFVPVSILEPAAAGLLEIELANTCTVRLRGHVEPALLRAAIRAAGGLDATRRGAD
jgi:transposase-like protein